MGIKRRHDRIETNPHVAHAHKGAEDVLPWDDVAYTMNMQNNPELGTTNTAVTCRAIHLSAVRKIRMKLMEYLDVRETMQTCMRKGEYAELEKEWKECQEDIDVRNARMRT